MNNMKLFRRMVCTAATLCVLICGMPLLEVNATETTLNGTHAVSPRATKDFDTSVSGGAAKTLSTVLSLEVGEVVTIWASYSPSGADVDFGLMDEDGGFYYVSGEDGSINTEIEVVETGNYKFTIRNNAAATISVSGYINY